MATGPTDWENQNRGKAASAFDKARQIQQEKQKEPPQAQRGSEQVKQSAPGMQPKPPSHVRGGPDRQAHGERMAKDDKGAKLDRARELKEAAIERRGSENSHEKGRGDKER